MNLKSALPLGFLFVLIAICGTAATAQSGQKPDLVVVVAIDQMQQQFFERFGEHFDGGLKRLYDEGVVYANAHHGHAPTNTAPGHAAISTGKYPGKHGIVNNSFYDRVAHEEMYCVGDDNVDVIGVENNGELPARSPRNLKSTTIGDWLKKNNSDSRVYSVSRKDRTAVLLGGQDADGAFWFDNLSTKFVTSSYYTDIYPTWADGFVCREKAADFIANGWHKKLPESAYAHLRPDDFDVEAGAFLADFPHTKDRMRPGIPSLTKDVVMLTVSPIGEKLVFDFAKLIIESVDLGNGAATDMLMVGCSAADGVGHHFGPQSHEVMDHFMHLDEYLGEFLDYLDDRFGKDNYWVVLTSDHGVVPMPEALQIEGVDARRIPTSQVVEIIDSIEVSVMQEFGLETILIEELMNGVYINYIETDSKGIRRKDIRDALARHIRHLDFVADAYTVDDLKGKEQRPYIDVYRKSFYKDLSPDIAIRLKPHYIAHGRLGTVHGSVYDYDTHVPVIFSVPNVAHQVVDRRVETVDIAPTLAAMLGVKADKKVDGRVLEELDPH